MDDEEETRATIPMPLSLRDRIRALAKLNGRPFNKHALWMLREQTEREERKVQQGPIREAANPKSNTNHR